ncbi:GYF domain-containing protein [Luteimonas terrae]|nr:GYF domain-containing protein [Luteimonas terrae]
MPEQAWYHATPAGERGGPMTADDLVRLYQAGRIFSTTPVWRTGMAGWTPLASVTASLGVSTPPPLPPPIPAAPLPPPRRRLHWIWIVLLALACAAVPVAAIVAAIAVPARNDYRHRAGVTEVIAASAPLRVAVQQTAAETGACPVTAIQADAALPALPSAALEMPLSTLHAHRHVKYVVTTQGDPATACVVRIGLRGFERSGLDDRALSWTLDPADGAWTCSASVARRHLPADCRD